MAQEMLRRRCASPVSPWALPLRRSGELCPPFSAEANLATSKKGKRFLPGTVTMTTALPALLLLCCAAAAAKATAAAAAALAEQVLLLLLLLRRLLRRLLCTLLLRRRARQTETINNLS
jgi:hypothetical protein